LGLLGFGVLKVVVSGHAVYAHFLSTCARSVGMPRALQQVRDALSEPSNDLATTSWLFGLEQAGCRRCAWFDRTLSASLPLFASLSPHWG